jgi:CxxC motif-containing protein (DUF1111 family)
MSIKSSQSIGFVSVYTRHAARALAVLLLMFVPCARADEDFTALGGDLTTNDPGRFAIQLPAPNLTDPERRQAMLDGFGVFHLMRDARSGRGPFFVNNSCVGCHVQNGKGPISFPKSLHRFSAMVVQVSRSGTTADGSPLPIPGVGAVLQERDARGRRRYDISLTWKTIRGLYGDGTRYTLRRPNLSFKIPGKNPARVRHSLRMSPAVVGPGLIEAISESAILSREDPDDLNGDGISGRANRVHDVRSNSKKVGRFGFKAVEPTVEQQSLIALFNEIGVENSMFKSRPSNPSEVSERDESILDSYQRLAGVPAARDQSDPTVARGRALFFEAGCDSCHTPSFVTDSGADPELKSQTIHPFSDFLLHDMGPGLADKHTHFDALGSEWKTTPLWALGFADTISEVKPAYLHDGRARTIAEAILWHGGEGLSSRERFRLMSKEDRDSLVAFLRSL